jgi:hypothetical protein
MNELTSRDLEWFRLANANAPTGFYAFKDRFLRRFATLVGYDEQRIEKECWTCDGSGKYFADERCRSCDGTGVHHVNTHYLLRYEICGRIYHKPVTFFGDVPENMRKAGPIAELEGRVKHDEVSSAVANRAFFRLLIRHEPTTYLELVKNRWVNGFLHFKARWAWRLIRLRNKMDLFPAVPPDDVPF